jgi:hypothetical protein
MDPAPDERIGSPDFSELGAGAGFRAERGGDRGKEVIAGVGVSEEGARLSVEKWVVAADAIKERNPLRRGKCAAFVDESI